MAVDVHHGVYRPCCFNSNPKWASITTIEEYWNSQTLLDLRQNLEHGIKDPGCSKCWELEDLGQHSLRQAVNNDLDRLSLVKNCSNYKIKQIKLITGSTCNLACMMCFDTISSTYRQLWESDKSWIMPIKKQTVLEYDYATDQYIRSNCNNIEFIDVLGGEPLFNKDFFNLLEYLVDNGASQNITLFIITNGTLFTTKIKQILLKFKKVVFTISIDGVGKINEYQRWPSQWNSIEQNLSLINADFFMSILPTVTAVNIIGLPQLIEFCNKNNYTVNNVNLVDHWTVLLPSNLPDLLKKQVSVEYQKFVEGSGNADNLIEFIKKWDTRRGIRIQDYMPEWNAIL